MKIKDINNIHQKHNKKESNQKKVKIVKIIFRNNNIYLKINKYKIIKRKMNK